MLLDVYKRQDNDLWGTDMTFGFQSAVDIATQVIDCIHTTATSHSRVSVSYTHLLSIKSFVK